MLNSRGDQESPFYLLTTHTIYIISLTGLVRLFKKYSEASKGMTSKVKCLGYVLVLKISQIIFVIGVNMSNSAHDFFSQ